MEEDNWDDLKEIGVGKTPSLTPVSTDSGSGEFNTFSYVGAAAAGGSKRPVFVIGESLIPRCFGTVGSNKFCLKECARGQAHCGVAKHATTKFRPNDFEAYLHVDRNAALTSPCLNMETLADEQRGLLAAHRFTPAEWEVFCDTVNEGGVLPSWLKMEDHKPSRSDPVSLVIDTSTAEKTPLPALLSPLRSDALVGIFKDPPTLAKLTRCPSEEEAEDEATVGLAIAQLQDHAQEVEQKWPVTFREVESSYMLVVDDLKRLFDVVQSMHGHIGDKDSGLFKSTTIWETLGDVQGNMHGVHAMQSQALAKLAELSGVTEATRLDMESTLSGVNQMKRDLQEALNRLGVAEDRLISYGKRFENIRPVIGKVRDLLFQSDQLHGGSNAALEGQLTGLSNRFDLLSRQVEQLTDASWEVGPPSASATKTFEEMIRDTNSRIKVLEQRVVGDGVSMGNVVFQSFEDMKTWVTTELPKYRYGLFVDAGGLLDLFAFIGFTDFDKSTASMTNIQKSGFATMYEARLTLSMQNVLPGIFGRPSGEGLDNSDFLPAVTDPDKWDNGSTGLAHQIARAMLDVEYQLEATINSVFDGYPAARQLAKDCLYQSKRFVTDLCNFISRELKAWVQRGYTKKEAWRIVCVCIRRIFEELHSARVVARDVRDINDPEFTAAKILWAVLKAHTVMTQYIKQHFAEHPSISAVIARHLASNAQRVDDGVSAKVTLLEAKLKSLTARLDRLETKAEKAENGGGPGKRGKKGNGKDRDGTPDP